ncbi:MAG TPA: glycosyltransferase [Acetivibrio sp.]|uniref:glycosyltransferase family 2 protein n=1 Tax=Acetivibrio sp. TaxID=1872092 RepID=UPI002CD2B66D|nr:glycosyltransferase [Acetivibrio sp.]HOM02595.1 glycosyltransferase [Acetivibrio sp.]
MSSLVTVIIPTYKGSNTILRAVDSVLNQTYKDIQIIVVDDNGKDTKEQQITQSVLQEYIDQNKILYLVHEKNINGSAARNTGLKYSDGKYICFLDDDDIFLPEKTKNQVSIFENSPEEIGMIVGSYRVQLPNGYHRDIIVSQPEDFVYEYLRHKISACSSAIMIKKNVLEKVDKWDESFMRHQDWEFFTRVAYNYKVRVISDICIVKFKIDRNLPKDPKVAERYRLHYLNKLYGIISELPNKKRNQVYAANYYDIGKEYLKSKMIINSLKWAIKTKKPIWAITRYIIDAYAFWRKKGLINNG